MDKVSVVSSKSNPVIFSATGKRKNSAARVYLKYGSGKIFVNNRNFSDYFTRLFHQALVKKPLSMLDLENKFDIKIVAKGGGLSGQAGAISHGITKAILIESHGNDEIKKKLRSSGLVTRDSRVVERKKYGKPKARKSFQFSKR